MRLLCAALVAVTPVTLVVPQASAEPATVSTVVTQPTSQDLRGVSFVDDLRGWAVGTNGTILATTNGGATWSSRSSGVTTLLTDVDFVDGQRGWAVGAGDAVLRTVDGGLTWSASATGVGGNLAAVDFIDAARGWAVGGAGAVATIAATVDGGQTWTPQVAEGPLGLIDVSFTDAQRGFAVGFLGTAYSTTDGGATWTPMAVGFDTFYATARDGDVGLISGSNGAILRSDDGGLTWREVFRLPRPMRSITLEGQRAIAAGDGGLMAASVDGAAWEAIPSGTTRGLKRLSAVDATRAWAVGDAGVVVTLTVSSEGLPAGEPLDLFFGSDSCGELAVSTPYAASSPALSATPVDLDGDGDDELAIGTLQGVRALIPGAPQLDAVAWTFDFHARVLDITAAQLDADPAQELIVSTANTVGSREGVFALDNDGTLLWSRRMPGGASRVEVADLNGDGVDDVLATGKANAVEVLNGSDGQALRAPITLSSAINDMAVGNLDNDGRADFVLATEDGRLVAFSGLAPAPLWTYRVEKGLLRAVELVDVDGDGLDDAITGGRGVPVSLVPGRGDGSLTLGTREGGLVAVVDGVTGTRVWDFGKADGALVFMGVSAGDLTGDGRLDVLAHAGDINGGFLWTFEGSGNLGEATPLWTFETTRPQSLHGLHNSDNLLTYEATGDAVQEAYVGTADGGLYAVSNAVVSRSGPQDPLSTPRAAPLWDQSGNHAQYRLAIAKLADGDALMTSAADGSVTLYDLATGDRHWRFDAGLTTFTTALDLDGDGDDEIGAVARSGALITSDENGPTVHGFLPSAGSAVAATDADGDGNDELVGASETGDITLVDPGGAGWATSVGGRLLTLAAGGGRIVAGLKDGNVIGLDAATGAEVWREAGERTSTMIYDSESAVFVLGGELGGVRTLTLDGTRKDSGQVAGSVQEIVITQLDADAKPEYGVAAGQGFAALDNDLTRLWQTSIGAFARSVAAVDPDGQGQDELVGLGFDKKAHAFDSTGSSLWSADIGFGVAVVATDVDGDGKQEAVVASTAGGAFDPIHVGGGNGIRVLDGAGAQIDSCNLVQGPYSLTSADLDGDGFGEVVIGTEVGSIQVLAGTGRGGDPRTSPGTTQTVLDLLAPSAGQYSDEVQLVGRLMTPAGDAVEGGDVLFRLSGHNGFREVRARTDASGVASAKLTLDMMPGTFELAASFPGDPGRLPSGDTAAFELLHEDTVLSLVQSGRGSQAVLRAQLADADSTVGIAGRVIRFFSEGALLGVAKTDQSGLAELNVSSSKPKSYSAAFQGDAFYLPSEKHI